MINLGTVENYVEDKYVPSQSFKRKNVLTKEEASFWFYYDWDKGGLKHRWAHYLRSDTVGWLGNNTMKFTLLGKHYSVATTIWTLFFGEVPEDFVVEFKDEDFTNTRIENLFIRHYSFISRKRNKASVDNFEKVYVGVSFTEENKWQAKFKGHSSFGSLSKTGPQRASVEEAREDYVRFKTEYMRGLFVYPLWSEKEVVDIQASKFLEEDMIEYFNSLPVYKYQLKFCYRDPYLQKKILPDTYSIGDGRNLNNPVIQKYFKKYDSIFKPRALHLKGCEKRRLKKLLASLQLLYKLPHAKRLSVDKTISLLSFHKAAGRTKTWLKEDKQLLDKAIQTQLLTSIQEDL